MSSFMPVKSLLSSSVIGRSVNIRKLNPIYLHIFLMAFTLCYKGKHYRKMIYISHNGIKEQLLRMYGIEVSRQQISRAMARFISLGLLERKTAKFLQQRNGRLYPIKQSFYRLQTRKA